MSVKLLTEHHLEFLSLTGGCTGSSESTLVKMPHCWISRRGSYCFTVLMLYSSCFRSLTPEKINEDFERMRKLGVFQAAPPDGQPYMDFTQEE